MRNIPVTVIVMAAFSAPACAQEIEEITVVGKRTAYANNAVTQSMMQQQTPLTSPLAQIDNLPGVSIQEGDTYGFDDWSTTIAVRGFQVNLDSQQLGMTIDGMPNGNSNYGGGAKANRYIDNQNVAGINVSQGTADVASRSLEALGGTLDFLTDAPDNESSLKTSLTTGEFDAQRYFVRYDTGSLFDSDIYAWVSVSHQQASDWVEESAENERDHFAAKLVANLDDITLTAYASYDDTHEDNYQRLFSPADFAAAPETDQLTAQWTGVPYVDQLYRRGWSTLRENTFAYGKVEWNAAEDITVTGGIYWHENEGRGDWVPPYLVNVTLDGVGNAESEYANPTSTVRGGAFLGQIFFVDPGGVALSPAAGCVSSITFPYGGAGPEYDPACYPANAIAVQSYRHTHYKKERTGFIGDIEWNTTFSGLQNRLRAGFWYEDGQRDEYRDWHKINDTRVGFDFQSPAYWRQYDREYPQDIFKWYIEDTIETDSFSFSLGVKEFSVDISREDLFGVSPDVSLDSDSDLLVSGGIVWRTPVDGLEVFGGYAENFSSISDNILERPDSDLTNIEPQTAENWDIGARYISERARISAVFYQIDFENRIIFLSNETTAGPNYIIGTNGTYFNAGGIESDGFEISAALDITENIQLYLSYTNNTSEYIGTGDALVDAAVGITPGNSVSGIPETMYVTGVDFNRGPFSMGVSAKYTDERYVNLSNTWQTDSYTLTDMYVTYRPMEVPGFMRGLEMSLTMNNVTDEDYLGGISGGGAWIGAPRTVAFTISLDLKGLE